MDNLLKHFKNIIGSKCNHAGATAKNCKYCPDCGKKIACKWIIIRCKVCGHYRKPLVNWLDKVKPMKKYCFYCGSDKWRSQNYYEATIPDSLKTIAISKVEKEKQVKFGSLTQKTKIWISSPRQ